MKLLDCLGDKRKPDIKTHRNPMKGILRPSIVDRIHWGEPTIVWYSAA